MLERYKDIKELILSTKGMFCDEVQHWRAETCQSISDLSIIKLTSYPFSVKYFPKR